MVDLDMVMEAGLLDAFDVVVKPMDCYKCKDFWNCDGQCDEQIAEMAIEMALNDCKAKHNGCKNCTVKCMWREE